METAEDTATVCRHIETRQDVIETLREHFDRVHGQLLLALPAEALSYLDDVLAAIGDDVLRALFIYGDEEDVRAATDRDISDLATIARLCDLETGFTVSIADHTAGLMIENSVLTDDADQQGIVFGDPRLYHLAKAWFIAHPWEMGEQWHIDSPPELPATYDDFGLATLQATLTLQADIPVTVEAMAKPTDENREFDIVRGQLVSTRQQFVYPKLSTVFGETTIFVRTDEGRVSMGGLDAYFEDYEARSVTLRPRID